MLQSLLRRLLLEKCEERERSSPGESLDDTEVVLRESQLYFLDQREGVKKKKKSTSKVKKLPSL